MKSALEVKKYKAKMIRRPTRAEATLMERLRLLGIPYKPQIIIGFYIVDVILHTKMVALEIDGKDHLYKKFYDEKRDLFIEKSGLKGNEMAIGYRTAFTPKLF